VDTDTLAGRAEQIRTRVAGAAERSGRSAEAVTIVAVSKTVPSKTIRAAYDLGFTTFGENRVQEAEAKIAALPLPGIHWDLIGHLQTNKVARASGLFGRIESVDSLRLAQRLNSAVAEHNRTLPILLEVNVGGESSKSGFAPDELMAAAAALTEFTNLWPQGVMTIAPMAEDPEQVRPIFQRLRSLRDQLRAQALPDRDGCWSELSMGMTDDFEVAIEEGATIVRIGRALFGVRPT
jgi:PLP dependent protein